MMKLAAPSKHYMPSLFAPLIRCRSLSATPEFAPPPDDDEDSTNTIGAGAGDALVLHACALPRARHLCETGGKSC